MKLKINELAKLLGVTTMTIRRYEDHGYINPERDSSDYRWYSEKDITKMVQLRLMRKCGFSHPALESITGSAVDKILEVSQQRLDEIDEEMRRLKYLRHWLKDNILMTNRISELGSGFMRRDCPPLRYVIYGTNEEIFGEKERLKTVNDFLYKVEEVQPIYLIKQNELSQPEPTLYCGLAFKEQDIERLGLDDIVKNDLYIEKYPMLDCVYSIISCGKTKKDLADARKDAYKRFKAYLEENSLEPSGDAVCYIIGMLGEQEHYMLSIPVKEKNK